MEVQSELKAKLKEAESALQKEKSSHDKDLAEKKDITKKLDESTKEVKDLESNVDKSKAKNTKVSQDLQKQKDKTNKYEAESV